ncbi:hypothetical protein RRG08_034200 [Elysia crispata]|uniref:Uncharacterized protein n=1 Tax=Elysia crispata TaxID=231223 RepID=A0AAE1DQF1_9GAST|nr:hypothetical protein RRG08_034200 [Elysia crispata]
MLSKAARSGLMEREEKDGRCIRNEQVESANHGLARERTLAVLSSGDSGQHDLELLWILRYCSKSRGLINNSAGRPNWLRPGEAGDEHRHD